MQLSIIIVNYNVKYFLEQCLCSVRKAVLGIDVEIFVVDNHSIDGSIEYLQPLFPEVSFIVNEKNLGFAAANNKALLHAKGEYILFLNPDTLVPEDCLADCISFLENDETTGAAGVRMIDGRGKFLPESKRSFPSPLISFFKLMGLSSLFPRSRFFNRYSLGWLDETKNYETEVLAGAFIMVRKQVLDKTSGFDESFFMYGEDVDLSYRIRKLGYKNYYLGEDCIIHFKGESSRKGSLNYVLMFYSAMKIFVNKHYGGSKAKLFSFFIRLAIWGRALLSILARLFNKIGLPLTDALIVFLSLFFVERGWVHFISHREFGTYFAPYAIPVFTLVFLLAATITGMYDNLYKPSKAFLSSVSAIIVMLAVYSLLPEQVRFSRGVILFGGILAGIVVITARWILIRSGIVAENHLSKKNHPCLIVGSLEEHDQVAHLLKQSGMEEKIIGRIKTTEDNEVALGDLSQLPVLIQKLMIRELIFCTDSLSYNKVIAVMQSISQKISFRFHSKNSGSIVGSDSSATTGETVASDSYYQIAQPYFKRMKRLVDIKFSLFLLLGFPVHLLFIKKGGHALANAFQVLSGKKTWVGYASEEKKLPPILPAVLNSYGEPLHQPSLLTKDALERIDLLYAREYDWLPDIQLILKNYRNLGG